MFARKHENLNGKNAASAAKKIRKRRSKNEKTTQYPALRRLNFHNDGL